MKRILIFIDWFSPGFKAGGPISSIVNLIDHLKNDHEFYVVTRNVDYTETTPYSGIQPDIWTKRNDGVHVFYFSGKNLNYKNLKRITHELQFDIAFINGIYSWYFSILPLILVKKLGIRIIVSSRGMLKSSALNVKKSKKVIFLKLAKLFGLYKKTIFHVTNIEERNDIQKTIGNVPIFVAPNLAKKNTHISLITKKKKPNDLKLINIARIAPEKNTLFALEALSRFSRNPLTKISYDLYGSIYDQDYWKECLKIINQSHQNIRIVNHGALENSLLAEKASQSHFFFMPTCGENFGHAILESLTAGCPVIISDQTPWRNLQEKGVGWDLPLDKPEEFIKVIEYCAAMRQEEYDQMSRNAFNYAQSIINNPKVLEANRKLFE